MVPSANVQRCTEAAMPMSAGLALLSKANVALGQELDAPSYEEGFWRQRKKTYIAAYHADLQGGERNSSHRAETGIFHVLVKKF